MDDDAGFQQGVGVFDVEDVAAHEAVGVLGVGRLRIRYQAFDISDARGGTKACSKAQGWSDEQQVP
jgi:hypothetical protein